MPVPGANAPGFPDFSPSALRIAQCRSLAGRSLFLDGPEPVRKSVRSKNRPSPRDYEITGQTVRFRPARAKNSPLKPLEALLSNSLLDSK